MKTRLAWIRLYSIHHRTWFVCLIHHWSWFFFRLLSSGVICLSALFIICDFFFGFYHQMWLFFSYADQMWFVCQNLLFNVICLLDFIIKCVFFSSNSAIIIEGGFFGRAFGNTLWLVAVTYYIYITFLGYSGKNTQISILKMIK